MTGNKLLRAIACITASAFLIASSGCGTQESSDTPTSTTEETAPSAAEITYPLLISAGYSTSEDDPRGVVLKKFKQTVEAGTNGNIIIDIHPNVSGGDGQLIKDLVDGKIDMAVSSAGNYSEYVPKIGVSALPFLFSDFESAWEFIDSDLMKNIGTELEAYNIHVLAYFDNGFRCVTTNTGAINSVEDMAGLRIRTSDNPIVMETMSRLSADPESLPFGQLKDALAAGAFDAQENPIPVIYNHGLYEVQKYLSITNHSYDAMPLTIRNDIWNALTPEYRAVIESAAKVAESENRLLVKQQTEDYVSKLIDAGMIVNTPENIDSLKAATAGVIDTFAADYDDELIAVIKRMYH